MIGIFVLIFVILQYLNHYVFYLYDFEKLFLDHIGSTLFRAFPLTSHRHTLVIIYSATWAKVYQMQVPKQFKKYVSYIVRPFKFYSCYQFM